MILKSLCVLKRKWLLRTLILLVVLLSENIVKLIKELASWTQPLIYWYSESEGASPRIVIAWVAGWSELLQPYYSWLRDLSQSDLYILMDIIIWVVIIEVTEEHLRFYTY